MSSTAGTVVAPHRPLVAVAWTALAAGVALGVMGLAGLLVMALATGDYWLGPEPWTGASLDLLTIGLALAAVGALLAVIVGPAGRWHRVAVVPPTLVLAFWWTLQLWLVLAHPVETLRGIRTFDVPTQIYSVPGEAALLVGLPTLLVVLVALHAGASRRQPSPKGS